MNNDAARFGLLTLSSSILSSTGSTPFVPNGTFAASSSTNTLQGPASQYGTLTFGTPAEQEEALRPRRDLRKQRGRLKASRALQQEAFQRVQSYLQNQEDRKAYPPGVYALPNLAEPGPSNVMYGMVNVKFGAGYEPLGMQAQVVNVDVPPPVSPAPYVPQSTIYPLSMCGHNPAQQHYVQAAAAPPASPTQEHASQLPDSALTPSYPL
ncbi:uncharacterized protein BJ212DRAFT_1474049 [Suillus subaureus]|uniref:Uncharacterized protein n=1 Tax=Suillus subaureus TaxID=48587 RepID=A0A9P7ENS0_9AGAM|nr:uncharacterized protein BJ212DRAFT_1474049 [Suillus subaureus]KAG1826834.1 hypothetical protein BJ212DRAFT_1474049 [Suillus subaureus]